MSEYAVARDYCFDMLASVPKFIRENYHADYTLLFFDLTTKSTMRLENRIDSLSDKEIFQIVCLVSSIGHVFTGFMFIDNLGKNYVLCVNFAGSQCSLVYNASYADDGLVVWYADGRLVQKRVDGTLCVKYADGTFSVEHVDGTFIVECTNGSNVARCDDGNLIVAYRDGSKVVKYVNGSVIASGYTCGDFGVYPDGSIIVRHADRSAVCVYTNGDLVVILADGSVVCAYADGTLSVRHDDDENLD